MKSKSGKSTYSAREELLSLSGPAIQALMRDVLAKGAPFRFRASGWSMAPFIRDGDVIRVSPMGAVSPRRGEVVAFVHPETKQLIVHRVVARLGSACLIRGDNVQGAPDGVIPAENILGRVTRVERSGKKVRLGLGPERLAISFLSANALLVPARVRLATLRRIFLRRDAR